MDWLDDILGWMVAMDSASPAYRLLLVFRVFWILGAVMRNVLIAETNAFLASLASHRSCNSINFSSLSISAFWLTAISNSLAGVVTVKLLIFTSVKFIFQYLLIKPVICHRVEQFGDLCFQAGKVEQINTEIA